MSVPTDLSFRTNIFIAGEFREAISGERFDTENPATGVTLAHIASGTADDVNLAVRAAREAFEDGRWSRRAPSERKATLFRMADLIEENSEELAFLDSLEAGKPIADCAETDLPETVATFRWYAETIDKVFDDVAPTGSGVLGLVRHEPIGVVGAVIPWNFPVMLAAWKAAPALAAGNSIIIKPSELTSLSALRLAELGAEAGLPDGVLSVVPGMGETAGRALGEHMDVDAVTFTGSGEVGRLFLQYAAESNLKRIVLECGGKSPQLVMKDAPDLELVAADVLNAGYANMGENCSCGSRLIVHRSLHDELVQRLIEGTGEWHVGDPLDTSTRIGPMIEEAHLRKVLSYIDVGREEGAFLALGGERVLTETGGYFVAPAIFDQVATSMRIAQEEIFGPVISTISFDTEEEAIALANGTKYGLAASLWTTNVDTALRVAGRVKAGTISVNCYSEGDITTPFGGYKESGFGGRDKGLAALGQYTEAKTVWLAIR